MTLGAVTLAVFPGQMAVTKRDHSLLLLPRGELIFECDRFSQGEIAAGKFPKIRKEEHINEKVEYQTVKINCCLRSVFILGLSPILHAAG